LKKFGLEGLSMDNHVLLSVDGLRKSFGDFCAVDDISFTVNRGEVFGLLGPNGAGKTTTIKMLCGLLKADSGEIVINGYSLNNNYNRIKSMIGLCPQEIVIWELLTCIEQLKFIIMSYDKSLKSAANRAESLLNSLGLWDKRNKLAKTLSGGMQRRLNIALAVAHEPELIILDEPQAGLDPQSRILVRDFIRQLAKEKTVILTTHDMDEADRLSDRVAIVDHGKILLIDTPDSIKQTSGAGDILQVRVSEVSKEQGEKVLASLPMDFAERKLTGGFFLFGANEVLGLIPVVNEIMSSFDIKVEDMIKIGRASCRERV
jgi:ABC-2 type transport system ATP-binding protein